MAHSGLLLVLLSQVFMEALTDVGPDCSRNFTDAQGIISTPNFPKEYPNNITCTFMILAPQNSEIELEFTSFSMEPGSLQSVFDIFLPQYKACTSDWVEIWDGLPAVGSFVGEYCGLISPHRVISYSGILSMIVTTDNNVTGEGFSANYTIRDRSASSGDQSKYTCGGRLKTFPGYLTSPGFPMEYPPSQRCLWVISAPEPTQKIILTFNSFFHLGDKQCENDYVEIYDGADERSSMLGRFCGSVAPSPLISSGSEVLIKFVTDDENSDQAGFSVRYDSYEEGPYCSRNFTDPQGVITTPNFPKKYPNNINCTFTILAPSTSEIMLEFTSFDMEYFAQDRDSCKYDWLEIWDGLPEVGSRIGKYCGSTSPDPVVSRSSILSMILITDTKIGREGFSASYTIRDRSASSGDQSKYTCGGHLKTFPGYLTSPGFPVEYLPSQRCLWVISAPEPTQKIILTFNSFFHLGDKQCENDYVEIYDGADERSSMLGRFCGSVAPSPLISSGSEVLIKFVTDDENSDQAGFSVRYDSYEEGPDCSRNFTDPQGVITTPNFPKKYPNNINCTFTILAPSTSEIMLEFTSFDMEYFAQDRDSCKYDWLEIWDGLPEVGSRIGKYCGSTSPDPVVSRSSILSMILITDTKISREGFSASYTIRDRKVD
ncbi:hypothetical protein INR49_005495 [Caranx melampygus]|nr:hypothetical protein INR49_005495 [Caranx melampygus]